MKKQVRKILSEDLGYIVLSQDVLQEGNYGKTITNKRVSYPTRPEFSATFPCNFLPNNHDPPGSTE
jgi:hypothetical protein